MVEKKDCLCELNVSCNFECFRQENCSTKPFLNTSNLNLKTKCKNIEISLPNITIQEHLLIRSRP